jgi:hypothetical protein
MTRSSITVRALALLILLVVVAASRAAAPADLTSLTRHLPDTTKLVFSMRLTPDVRDWLFAAFPVNPETYKKIATEQCAQFAKATGFDPMQDVEGMVIAAGDQGKDAAPNVIALVRTKSDVVRLGKAVASDAKLARVVRKSESKGITILGVEKVDIAFLPGVLVVGPTGSLKALIERTADPASNSTFLGQIPGGLLSKALVYLTAELPRAAMKNAAANPQVSQMGGGILARLQHLTVALDDHDLLVAFRLDSKDAAAVASDQIKGMLTTAKGVLEGFSKAPPADQASPIDLIHPKLVLGRVAALTGLSAVTSIQVTADGETTRLVLPKDKMPIFKGGMSVFVIGVALAAGAVAGMNQNQVSQEKEACYANQRLLTGALELYNTDKKKQAKLEEVAEELVTSKYLPEGKPDDPGQGTGSFKNYATSPDGTVACKLHGRPEPAVVTPTPTVAPGALPSPAPTPAEPQEGGDEKPGDQEKKPDPAASPRGEEPSGQNQD